MREATFQRWRDRIEKSAALLASRLDEPPTLRELAGAAGVSPFHFHRVWRAMTGRTVRETLRHLRVRQAARELVDSKASITVIGMTAGFATSQGFARAFRHETGFSPTAFRAGVGGETAQGKQPYDTMIEIVPVDPLTIVAKRRTGLPYENLNEEFGAVWAWAEKAGAIEQLRGIYGIPYDDPLSVPVSKLRYDACLDLGEAADVPDHLHVLNIGDGEHARFCIRGAYGWLEEATQLLVGDWLLRSGREPDDAPIFHHFHNDPETTAEADLVTDIFLPLAPTTETKP